MRIDSIRLRLTLWYAGILSVALLAMAAATYTALDRLATRRATLSLAETAGTVLATRRGDGLTAAVRRFRAPDRRVLLLRGDSVVARSSPPQFGPSPAAEVFAAVPLATLLASRSQGPGRTTVMRLRPGDPPVRIAVRRLRRGGQGARLVVVASTRVERELRAQARLALGVAAAVALLIAVIPGSLLVRRSLAPVGDMTRQAARIGAARLGERLPVGNPRDELGGLALVLNDLLDRLQTAFAQQRRFMAEAAHELRTPVAVVRAEAELALAGERSATQYRDALAVVYGESERLGRLVDDLLTLSRAEAGQYPLRPGSADLAEIVAEVVRSHRALARAQGVDLAAETADELPLTADADLLTRMLRNLVENAVKHGRAGDRVRVTAERAGDVYRIRVADTGPGIADESRERIWEPFFRGSDARAGAAEGGAGLGLPIARWIAQAHGGRLELLESGPQGSVFEAVLPAGSG